MLSPSKNSNYMSLTVTELFYCELWLTGEQRRYDLEVIFIAQKLHKSREINQVF